MELGRWAKDQGWAGEWVWAEVDEATRGREVIVFVQAAGLKLFIKQAHLVAR
jgi:hypothetical protein